MTRAKRIRALAATMLACSGPEIDYRFEAPEALATAALIIDALDALPVPVEKSVNAPDLLRRIVTYAVEDCAVTPGSTRLARAVLEARQAGFYPIIGRKGGEDGE